jgi:hypothetical protein
LAPAEFSRYLSCLAVMSWPYGISELTVECSATFWCISKEPARFQEADVSQDSSDKRITSRDMAEIWTSLHIEQGRHGDMAMRS